MSLLEALLRKVAAPAHAEGVGEDSHATMGLGHGFLLGWRLGLGVRLQLGWGLVQTLLLAGPLLAQEHAQQLIAMRAVGLGLGQRLGLVALWELLGTQWCSWGSQVLLAAAAGRRR